MVEIVPAVALLRLARLLRIKISRLFLLYRGVDLRRLLYRRTEPSKGCPATLDVVDFVEFGVRLDTASELAKLIRGSGARGRDGV